MRARTLHGLIALVVVVTTLGCEEPPPAIDEVILTLRSASPLVTLPAVEPSRLAPEARALGPRRFVLPRRAMPHEITLDGFCPVTPSVTEGPVLDVALTPLVELVAPAPVGHDAAFTVEVRPGCREALAGSVTWQLLDGASTPLTIERRGFVVRGRTAPWDPPSAPRWGIVPVSAARAAAITLAMHYTRPDQPPIVREVIVLAAARATGVPSVPLGAGVLLRGGPFRVVERPRGSQSAPLPVDHELERLVPDASGRWVLEDASGRPLSLRSGEHVATPLDCGRGPCHARETELVLASPMTSSLARRSSEPCALRCHAVGEPGLPDGGFAHVALRVGWPTGVRGEVMPRALRRLAGVGCTACHGPGAIPEASARWAILRTDVCASCHDAPPRYGHVAAWASTRMATSDRAPETREPGCADCHTTAGFLAAIGARAATSVPEEAGPAGIGCAACHAPHAEARLPRAL
ncbi:MAG: cytochrome c family protein, partial [Sandaracinaceae bacterium]|nr:cytochrome c family protein [Sandaracinaceae bacterium]